MPSHPPSQTHVKPPMKIIIVGGGLSGLTTAIALRKYVSPLTLLSIKIYERPIQPDDDDNDPTGDTTERRTRNLGAGLSLQSNGLRVLESLDEDLKNRVVAVGFPCSHFKWMTASGVLLAREYMDLLPVSRPLLVGCLEGCLKDMGGGEVTVEYRGVQRVVVQQGRKPMVEFVDGGGNESADLVVGADGVGSVVRRSLFDDEDGDGKYKPEYLGTCGVGGTLDIDLPSHLLTDPSLVFTIGPTGHFGYTGLTNLNPSQLLYWSLWETPLPPRGQTPDLNILQHDLQVRHNTWTDPIIKQCLNRSRPDNIYPIFVTPELPHWGVDGVVLIGDAAHALPPRTGQGSSQAFEDAQTLALLLAGLLTRSPSPGYLDVAVARAIHGIYRIRSERVYRMRREAMAWRDPKMPMGWWGTGLLYGFLALYPRVRSLMGWLWGVERGWDVKESVDLYLAGEDREDREVKGGG